MLACGDDSTAFDASTDAPAVDALAVDAPSVDAPNMDAPAIDAPRDAPTGGRVTFSPVYENGSAWETNTEAREMVDRVFAQFGALLRTSGDWDATIEVYLTDDNTNNANASFWDHVDVTFEGQMLRAVPAWAAIIQGVDDGPARSDGTGTEFILHFNVNAHSDNDGLLRHEMMHGLGAVNLLPNFIVTENGELTAPTPGSRVAAAVYDRALVDLDGNALLSNYDDGTFEVQPYRIEATLTEWMDGDGGIFFRGVADDGADLDMSCGTFPAGPGQGAIVLNEPSLVMAAGVHPTWDTLEEPDRAFLRALGYELND